jgi:hypothetical protein
VCVFHISYLVFGVGVRWRRPPVIVIDRHIRYYVRTMTARVSLKKVAGRDPQGAWRQDELIGGKPPVVKEL